MEHKKQMMICALYGAPHYLRHFPRKQQSQTKRLGPNLGHLPRKKRSQTKRLCPNLGHFPRKKRSQTIRLGPKRRLDFNETSFPRKKRIVMFNETDMASVELNTTCNNSRVEEHGKENRMMIMGSKKNEELPLLKGKSFIDKDISTPRKQKGKMAPEEKQVDTIAMVGPMTPSPEKQKRVRNKNEKKMLVNVSEKVESAHYYTRTLNSFVLSEFERQNKLSNQPKAIYNLVDDKMVLVKRLTKKIQFGPSFPRELKAWKVLLSESRPESIGSSRNKDNGICREVYFIYKVGYIQGSRVHLPWKGSVLDSVIGALLTQRVADNSSSSAFMSLGTIFPQYSTCDLYSRHHRIMRVKRSIACSSQQIPAQKYAVNFIKKQENVSKLINKGKSMERKVLKKEKRKPDWNNLRADCVETSETERDADKIDSVDWHAVMRANVDDIAEAILFRGMNKKLAIRMKDFLNRLVLNHGNLDLEWLRKVDSQNAKYVMVLCHGFNFDLVIGVATYVDSSQVPDTAIFGDIFEEVIRVIHGQYDVLENLICRDFLLSIHGIGTKSAECVRLLALRQPAFPVDINVARVTVRLGWVPAPPISDDIQMYLLDQSSKLHDLIHQYLWSRLCKLDNETLHQLHCHMITFGKVFCTKQKPNCAECPMRLDCRYYSSLADRLEAIDIEDLGNSQMAMIEAKPATSIRESERKKCKVKEALIVVLPEHFVEAPTTPIKRPFSRSQSITSRKGTSLKVTRRGRNKTRTEHIIYELPDWHPILETFDDRDPDDLSPYLLITRETDLEKTEESSAKKSQSTNRVKGFRVVLGTIMIPCRTALRGNFPLNATYFQPNEVFADQQTHRIPVDFPRTQLQGLPRKTLYCGTNLTGIVKGRSGNEIRRLFHEGYICTRIFDRKTCATRTLDKLLHNPKNKEVEE